MGNKICQHLENVYILVNQYLQNGQFVMVQNHAWVKPFKMQDKQLILI